MIVLVCPEEQCCQVEGSMRVRKRVELVWNLLYDIDGLRLSLFNISSGDKEVAIEMVRKILSDIINWGPNPTVQFQIMVRNHV